MLLSYLFDYGVDFQRRIINLTGDVDQSMYELLDAAMTEMEAESRATITIKINSPGGETYQAMAIVGRIRESKCKIVTKGYGEVMSAATLILACGDLRLMSRHGFFMYHETSYELEGRHSSNRATVHQIEKEEKFWANCMAEFSKKSSDYWLKNGVGKDAYFSAEQLVSMGVVDELF